MSGRISNNGSYHQIRTAIAKNYAGLFKSQTLLSTGRRILSPSDDPVGTRRVLSLENQQRSLQRYRQTTDAARAYLDSAASSLVGMSTSVARVRELAVSGGNGTNSAADRQSIAAEIDSILGSMIGAANTSFDGRHLFSGTATDVVPFQRVERPNGLTQVVYLGNQETQNVEVGPAIFATTNLPGSSIFAAGPRSPTTFRGTTGAAPGAGTDSMTGRARLDLLHQQTSFGMSPTSLGQDPLTGLRPGPSSAASDTILGAHSLTVTSDALGNGTLSLNGGTPMTFAAGSAEVAVTGPNGEVVHVDVSQITPGLPSTTIPLNSTGSFSLDGGATRTPIDFSAATQTLQDPLTGGVMHIDARQVKFAGSEEVSFGSSFDLFSSIVAIRDVLRDPARPASEVSAEVLARLADLDRAEESLTSGIATLGTRSGQLDATESRLSDLDVTLSRLKSETQDVDLVSVLIDLKEQESLYQSSLALASRVNQLSLLNYI